MPRYIVEYDCDWGFNGTYWVCDNTIGDGEACNVAGFGTLSEAQAYADKLNSEQIKT